MKYEKLAERFTDAIIKMADDMVALDAFECYLSHHFDTWLSKYSNSPEEFVCEFIRFISD